MSDDAGDIVLTLEDVSKAYTGTLAVSHVTFHVRRAAVNVLVGENGAGKSTLMKIIAGVEQPSQGRILLDGKSVHFPSTAEAVAHGIGMVFQELNLFGNLSVAENIFATREVVRGPRGIDHKEQERRAGELMARLQAGIDPRTLVEDLRVGQQQLVEIAKAVSQNARILIMDEPTSALSATEVEVLFRVIADLKREGVAIVYISHRLEELIRIGDYITVLRDGRITGEELVRNIDTHWIVRQMIGRDAKEFAKELGHSVGEVVLRAENVSLPRVTGDLAVDHVSLDVRSGEILGLYGLMGAGRSELLDCIMGRQRLATGKVSVCGKAVEKLDTTARIASGLALIPEDRQREGHVAVMSIAENLTMASLKRFVRFVHISRPAERAAVNQVIKDLTIKAVDPGLPVSSLSGGNQQKVVIGKALLTNPKVLLMDEPSRGIDVGAKADVFMAMRRLAAEGLGILFVTSDLEEVMALSDRIAVMSNGRLTALFAREEATEGKVVAASAAGHGPTPVHAALRERSPA